ncbi:hypothetical protein EVJ58_g10715 [Rhodofomes roseus]|uniref:Uncharacterized protein n=1 Tax=Rhodofomes roseus TaxID=34475 RepID=A0A4Y9XPK5_9APHY|nr:hypothetical protein EVJ58_g10715 [Rhodofomes roseus]
MMIGIMVVIVDDKSADYTRLWDLGKDRDETPRAKENVQVKPDVLLVDWAEEASSAIYLYSMSREGIRRPDEAPSGSGIKAEHDM